jgi:hypothetical protein
MTARDTEFSCSCGYTNKFYKVRMHRLNNKRPECQGALVVKSGGEVIPPVIPEPKIMDEEAQRASVWDTEDSDETEDDYDVVPPAISSGVGSSESSSSSQRVTLTPVNIAPTDSRYNIRISVENLALFDMDRGEGYTGTVEEWVNEIIHFHFLHCQGISLQAIQLIPVESA